MSVGAVNKNTGDRIPTAGMTAVDSVLSGTSTNPVQNRVVKAALDDKQDKTDNTLQTTDKTVVGAINEHEGDISSLMSGLTNVDVALDVPKGTGKNRLTNTATTTTTNGVTFTVNDDGTVTLNGETTAQDTNFTIFNPWTAIGEYILNGVPESAPSGTKLQAFMTGKTVEDTGSGVALNVVTGDSYRIRITITGTGIVFNNVTIKPMIRLASVSDSTFTPYIPSVESRIEAVEVSLVAQSGSTGTIAAKLNSMVSALNALSTDRKRNAVLLMGTTVFHIANTQSNQFTQASYSTNTTTTTIRCIDMIANASTYNVTRLTTSGVSMEDVSSTENTTVFYLYA